MEKLLPNLDPAGKSLDTANNLTNRISREQALVQTLKSVSVFYSSILPFNRYVFLLLPCSLLSTLVRLSPSLSSLFHRYWQYSPFESTCFSTVRYFPLTSSKSKPDFYYQFLVALLLVSLLTMINVKNITIQIKFIFLFQENNSCINRKSNPDFSLSMQVA